MKRWLMIMVMSSDYYDIGGYHWLFQVFYKWTASRSERFLVAALRDYVRKAEQEERHLATDTA